MKKLGTLLLGGAVTLGIGAGAIFGNGVIASQVMLSNINPESPTTISSPNMADTSQGEATIAAESEEYITEAKSSTVMLADYAKDGGAIMVNGKKAHHKAYVLGQPGANDISSQKAIDTAKKELTQKYALKQELIEKFEITAKYYTEYEEISVPVWWVNLYPVNADDFTEIGCYTALIDASTGEAIQLLSAADGKG